MTQEYTVLVFDSRNTAIPHKHTVTGGDRAQIALTASNYAKGLSMRNKHKVLIEESDSRHFEEYKWGVLESWSFPNGLGQIKINS